MKKSLLAVSLLALMSAGATAQEGLVEFKVMSLDTAENAAKATLVACREQGFQVSVAVVDRFGNLQVLLRDRFAGAHTPDTSRRKAWTAVSFRTDTLELSRLTEAGSAQAAARDITGALMLGGGITVEAAGSIVGGIGVSGAPTGEDDAACAEAGRAAVVPHLEF